MSAQEQEKDLLRFITCGSVDDGKSTLIGRLLHDSKQVFKDQLSAVRKDSLRFGTTGKEIDYALLLDGLQAEREQKITIDVAYRYFETSVRKFIIADTPGHVQYTRNMVTGASTADLALVLVDASRGLLTQTRRHTFILSLLRIPHLVLVVNKMDLVGYREEIFQSIVTEFKSFIEKLEVPDVTFLPVSALNGDNIVTPSDHMPWYSGRPLLHHLESIYIQSGHNLIDFRFPVQSVIRPHQHFRGYAGRIESGTVKVGEEIVALPSGATSRIKSITTYDGELSHSFAPQSVTITLEDELDISRGDMIVRANNVPLTGSRIDASICWMDERPLSPATYYLMKHMTSTVKVRIANIFYRINMDTLHREEAATLSLNDISRVELESTRNLYFDAYRENRATGSFILIDPMTNYTVAAGMIRGSYRSYGDIALPAPGAARSTNIRRESSGVSLAAREQKNGHQACVIWFTGLSGSGKSTVARHLLRELFARGCQTAMLDGDNLRHGLCSDLGFSDTDREENIRRAAETAKLFYDNGSIVLCSFISPFEKNRVFARSLLPQSRFFEIYVKCSLDVCKLRDPKGLYARALKGEIQRFTGIDSPYEEPLAPELIVETDIESPGEITGRVLDTLREQRIIS